jgi:tetratricopeptide (TPR) repeat protein
MRKQPDKIQKINALRAKTNLSTPASVEEHSSFISHARLWIIELGGIGLVACALFVFINEVRRPEIVIDTINVPEDLEKSGYTSVVVAEKLADEAHKINLTIRDLSAKNSWHKEVLNLNEIGASSASTDISLPVAQTSVRSIARFLRQEFGLNSIYIRGEIVNDKKKLLLTLRKISAGDTPPAERVVVNQDNIEQLFSAGGMSLLKLTTPTAIAINAYHKFANALSKPPQEDSNFTEAIEAFEYCIKYAPPAEDKLAYTLWGNALSDLKRPEEAIEQFKKAIALDPNYAYAYNNWGSALSALKRPEEAIELFKKAVTLDPNYAYAYNNWGNALYTLKRPAEAIEQFQKAVSLDPNDAVAYNNWGNALYTLKRPAEAIEQYKKAIALDPKYAFAYNNCGSALFALKRPEEAIELFKNAIALDPNFSFAYFNWGLALKDLNLPKEAAEKFAIAAKLKGKK